MHQTRYHDTTVASESTASPTIVVRQLLKRFKRQGGGQVVPVDHVDLEVGAHEMVVLLGPSGCGKTTLLRCVAGLEHPDEGEISIAGELVYSAATDVFLPPNRRPASMIFQSYALWPHMTVQENVSYPLEARGMKRSQSGALVSDTLRMVGLAGLEASHPGQISGGQQQRVALARAVISDSRVILFDEPLSNVDAKVREQLRMEIRTMQKRLGFCGLYVTHDQTEAMAIADRIAVIDQGRIVQLADPMTIYDHPASLYVARFVGNANTWAGVVAGKDGDLLVIETQLGHIRAAAPAGNAVPATGSKVTLMCRPERIKLLADGEDAVNRWNARVIAREFLGAHTELLADSAGVPFRLWLDRRQDSAISDSLTLGLDPQFVRVFPASGD